MTARRFEEIFARIARYWSWQLGRARSFVLGVAIIVVWGVTGPLFRYSDTWQLIINTGTTIATFLMVFLIQNTQNRDALELHLKIDELIRASDKAHNRMINLEKLTERQIERLQQDFHQLGDRDDDAAD